MECVNLNELFGKQYRISFDDCVPKSGSGRDSMRRDPWMMQIPCQRGVIYPFDACMLAVEIDGHPKLAAKLRRMKCTEVVQDGETEVTLIFDVADFDQIAQIVLPRRRRQVSDQERDRLRSMSKRFGFKRHQSGHSQGPRTSSNQAT